MLRRCFLFLAGVSAPSIAVAGEAPLYMPVPDWVVAAPSPTSLERRPTGTTFVVHDQQERMDGTGNWKFVEQVLQATSTEALKAMGTVNLQWNPQKGDLIVHRLEILRGAQVIDALAKPARFTVLRREEMLEYQEITGALTATMNVEGLQIGDMLRLSFSTTHRDSALRDNVETATSLLAEPVTPAFARYRLLWPTAKSIRWKTSGKLPTPQVVRKGAQNELSISLPLPKQPDVPASAPARFRRPAIFEATSFADWPSVSKTAAELYQTKGLIAPGTPLAAEVDTIASATPDPRKRVALALRLVQDKIRYLAVAMGDGNYVPQSPSQTWEVRYGDCKAKTLLLLALLHRLNIDAEPVLADVYVGDGVANRLPSFGAFNHILVKADVGGKTLWLDGTGSGTREADLEDTPGFGHVLPATTAGSSLMTIATRASARPDATVDLEADQSAGLGFPSPYKARMTTKGAGAIGFHAAFTQAGAEQKRELVKAAVTPIINNGSVVTWDVTFDDDAALLTISATGLANFRWPKVDGRQEYVVGTPYPRLPDSATSTDGQTFPVALPFPQHVEARLRLKLPDYGGDFTLKGGDKYSESVGGFDVEMSTKRDGQWIAVDGRSAAHSREIPADQIPTTRQKLEEMRAHNATVIAPANYPPRWMEVNIARQRAGFGQIMALLDKDIAESTDKAPAYLNRASMLAGLYDRERAISDLGEAIKLQPDINAYLSRADLFAQQGNMKAAIADLEAARDLDPGSAAALSMLTEFLGTSGRLDEALRIVDSRISLGGNEKSAFQGLKAHVLSLAGRQDEALQLLNDAIQTNPGNPTLLNARCWLRGTRSIELDQGLKDCTRAIELSTNSHSMLHSRALVYFRMQRIEEALADLAAAETVTPGSHQVLYLRGIIKRSSGDKSGAEELATARLMSPRSAKEYEAYGLLP